MICRCIAVLCRAGGVSGVPRNLGGLACGFLVRGGGGVPVPCDVLSDLPKTWESRRSKLSVFVLWSDQSIRSCIYEMWCDEHGAHMLFPHAQPEASTTLLRDMAW
jgi:hypothetical protein